MTVDLHVLCEQFRELKPPQHRDRLIFEAVAVKQRSQTEVAREHGISQPRVAQIVVEVGRWVARVRPARLRPQPAGGGGRARGSRPRRGGCTDRPRC